MKFFRGCTALITGASSGIGLEIAHQLAPEADRLVLVARRLDRLDALKQELNHFYPDLRIDTYGLDLCDASQTEFFFEWLETKDIRINLLVNNAGLGDYGFFEDGDWERVQRMIDVNITALTRFTYRMLPQLREFQLGAILNVSSVAGMLPLPGEAVYAATKAYVNSFTEALRMEVQGTGIIVTTVCPGPVETEFNEVARRSPEDHSPAPEFLKVSAPQVAYDALMAVAADRARVIPGWAMFIAMTLATALPLFILRIILRPRR